MSDYTSKRKVLTLIKNLFFFVEGVQKRGLFVTEGPIK